MDQSAAHSAAQMEKAMKPLFAWKAKIQNHIVDLGAPLGHAQEQNKAGEWSGSNKQVSGYTVQKAENYEAAQALDLLQQIKVNKSKPMQMAQGLSQ